jgi:hypothetical protein
MAWEMVVSNKDQKNLIQAKKKVNQKTKNKWGLIISKQLKT